MDAFASRAFKPMLIGSERQAFDDPEYLFELKLDGERALVYLDESGTELINRRGRKILHQFPELREIHRQVKHRCVLDGELIVMRAGVPDFEGMKQRWLSGGGLAAEVLSRQIPVSLVVFDILYDRDREVTALPLEQRKERLEQAIERENELLSTARFVENNGKAFWELARAQKLEGIIAKAKSSRYLPGRRTREWAKIKNLMEDDFVICGYLPQPDAAVISLVLGQYERADNLIYCGRVTLGKQTEEYREVQKIPRVEKAPFDPLPLGNRDAIWLKPQMVCRVEFLRRMESGQMRLPHFGCLRPDKPPEEAVFEVGRMVPFLE